jgi:tetratricopeptide (TPR) repeat protein
MRTSIRIAAAAVVTAMLMLASLPANAASPAETLEKGIYNEETTGNLDEAIKHYRQVLSDAQKTERLAAQAQYRLGRCLNKQGKKQEAAEAFKTLIRKSWSPKLARCCPVSLSCCRLRGNPAND